MHITFQQIDNVLVEISAAARLEVLCLPFCPELDLIGVFLIGRLWVFIPSGGMNKTSAPAIFNKGKDFINYF